MNKVLNLTYSSSLSNICEVNTSFDSGVLRIAYAGENRNKSYISKETFEKCIKTIYNCPIVCSYNREEDSIGGHDMDVVRDNDGTLRLVNITTPIGCIPESANIYWQTVEEEDGTTHEYLCADALLWKRQEAYQKIKNDGYSAQSMEITVKDGRKDGDIYNIFDFEFTAFALIGVEPCFESAALEFSKQDFKQQLSQMMTEIKETFSNAKPSFEDSIINAGKRKEEIMLKEKMELAAKYGINTDELEFSMLDFSLEELEEKFKEIKSLADNDGKNY